LNDSVQCNDGSVVRELVGAGVSSVKPGNDRRIYGNARLHPVTPVETRSFQTFVLTYTVGSLGLDDTGSICVCFRVMSDLGSLQTHDPKAPNFVTASCTGSGSISLQFDPDGGQRPFNKRLLARLDGGFLKEGEEIKIVFGDTSGGSPGFLMQTFAEAAFEFRVMVDAVATRHFEPLDELLAVPVVAGPPERWKAVLPTLRRPGEPFHLGIKAEDKWGNPTAKTQAQLRLEANMPVEGLPETVTFSGNQRSVIVENLKTTNPGVIFIKVFDEEAMIAEAGPLVIKDSAHSGYWADLHGQSGETVGVGRIDDYFDFARNLAFLDATSHQGNDFQINDTFWKHLNKTTAKYDEPGRFVAFPGYEWSGNTAVGGDHNVFFRHEGRAIRRSSHALLADRTEEPGDANTLSDLYDALAEEDCVLYAHVGGRYANIAYAHDPKLETAFELHSAWGTFEWLLKDAFDLGYRVGVVCNSDGHKGRPGASYPGASTFGAYGGLTCFLTGRLDRDAIFEAMRSRHHYGTTGSRIHLEVNAEFTTPAILVKNAPAPDASVSSAMMGDIVKVADDQITLRVEVDAPAGIERIEIRNGRESVETHRPYDREDLGQRIRIVWSGAEYRGRGRNTEWRGRAGFKGAAIHNFHKINAWNHERLFEQVGSNQIIWDSITTGNFTGFDAWAKGADNASLEITTNRGDLALQLRDIGIEDHVLDAGGLDRKLRVFRLPDNNAHRSMSIETQLKLNTGRDNPLWVCVTTEDGHQAWSSPIYAVKP
jgi:hypothetical protein